MPFNTELTRRLGIRGKPSMSDVLDSSMFLELELVILSKAVPRI